MSPSWPFFSIFNLVWWLTCFYIHGVCYLISAGSVYGVFPAVTISILMAIAFVKYAD